MNQPLFPSCVPRGARKRYRLRFSLLTLLILMSCTGPIVLVAAEIPMAFLCLEIGMILFVTLTTWGAWRASFVRPAYLAFCFLVLSLLFTVLGVLLFVGAETVFAEILASMVISLWAVVTTGIAFGLSCSRFAP